MNKELSALLQRAFILLVFAYFLFVATLGYAQPIPGLPFHIFPQAGTTLPTKVIVGTTATAFYTVRNHTLEQRNGNFVKYLPPNVEQDTGIGSTCGPTFDLAPEGQAGDSCTLKLTIFGPVDGNDPDPHHHLFVCFPGGITCAGTANGLNVSSVSVLSVAVTPVTATINVGSNLQYTAIATFSDGSTENVTTSSIWNSSNPAAATINPATGLAHGVAIGTTIITTTFNGVTSNAATLTVINPLVSILISPAMATKHVGETQQYTAIGTFTDGSSADITATVSWSSSNAAVATITPGPNGGLATAVSVGTTNITATQSGITSNAAVLTVDNPLVSIAVTPPAAAVSPGGTQQFTATGTFFDGTTADITTSVTWNSSNTAVATIVVGPSPSGGLATGVAPGTSNITATLGAVVSPPAVLTVTSLLYVVNNGTTISFCGVQANGAFTCLPVVQPPTITNPQQIALNPAGTRAYVTTNADTVFVCATDPTFGLTGCAQTAATTTFVGIGPVTINPADTFAYIGDTGHVYRCVISATDGTLSACAPSSVGAVALPPAGIAINAAGTFAYITKTTPQTVSYCPIDPTTGALSPCISTGDGFDFVAPWGITLKGNIAYITDNSQIGNILAVIACDAIAGGVLNNCHRTGDNNFTNPRGIAINFAGTFAYVSNFGINFGTYRVLYCAVSGQNLTGCIPVTDAFVTPFGIAIH